MRKSVFIPILLISIANLVAGSAGTDESGYAEARNRLVKDYIESQGITDPAVLNAMREVPRHAFVPEDLVSSAYKDRPLPIGEGQTISQPYVVALMTASLGLTKTDRVLEIGTGSGYQTAVLARLAEEVYSIERLEPVLRTTRGRLLRLGVRNLRYKLGDGTRGWPEQAPYDGIMVTAAPTTLPTELIDQLAVGARLVIPVGAPGNQQLLVVQRTEDGHVSEELQRVSFVPLVEGAT